MGLQLRLRHALGSRIYDFAPRGAERPIVVGRATTADVQVPSTLVDPCHCLLFMHEGRWIVQSGSTNQPTCVNGSPIEDAAYIELGDLISLGDQPTAPVLEIDPLGVGRRFTPASAAAAGPGSVPPQPRGLSPSADLLPQAAEAEYDQASAADDDYVSLGSATQAPAPVIPYYVPHRRASKAAFVVGAVIAVAITGLGLMLLLLRPSSARPTQPIASPSPRPSIFEAQAPPARPPQRQRSELPRPQPTPAPPEPVQAPEPAPAAAPPRAPDQPPPPGWDLIEQADRELSDLQPEVALLRFEMYRRQHPNNPLAADLSAMTARATDMLWWHRVNQICLARNQHQARIDQIDRDLAETSTTEFKNERMDQRRREQELQRRCVELLTELGYKGNEPPPLENPDQLPALRQTRNAQIYKTWKDRALARIGSSGKVPWSPPP